MATSILASIGKFLGKVGVEQFQKNFEEAYGSKEIEVGEARGAIVKFVEECDKRQRFGLGKGYCEMIEELYEKLRTEEWYVVMMKEKPLKGTHGHKYWEYLSGKHLMNHVWHHEKYDGHPEGKMFLRVHLHILLDAVGFEMKYREEVIEKHWGDILSIDRNYEYGQIWNMYFAYSFPQKLQFFDTHGGTLCGAVKWKWLTTVFNMYKEVLRFLQQEGKIEKPILHYKDEYYVLTVFASGAGKQSIS